jgi:hypothetical protein
LIGIPASACFRKAMISSSVKRYFLMSVILHKINGLHELYIGAAEGAQVNYKRCFLTIGI